MLQKKLKCLAVLLLVALTAGCAAKNSECKIGLFNSLLERHMPYVKKKVNSAKPIIIQKVNSKISEIPPFDETIHIDTSNTGVPSNLKASVEFSSAQTSISKLSDDTLTLYDPNLDSSCRRLDLPFIMSIRSATKIPIFIDGIPNLDHYKKHFSVISSSEKLKTATLF